MARHLVIGSLQPSIRDGSRRIESIWLPCFSRIALRAFGNCLALEVEHQITEIQREIHQIAAAVAAGSEEISVCGEKPMNVAVFIERDRDIIPKSGIVCYEVVPSSADEHQRAHTLRSFVNIIFEYHGGGFQRTVLN